MVASLAKTRRTIAITTRSFRSRRLEGQIYGHSPISVDSSEPPGSEEISRFSARVDRKVPSDIAGPSGRRAVGTVKRLYSYRNFPKTITLVSMASPDLSEGACGAPPPMPHHSL